MEFIKANSNYWSKNPLYNFQLSYVIMSQNRFELLQINFHYLLICLLSVTIGLEKYFQQYFSTNYKESLKKYSRSKNTLSLIKR